jgi:hypothetical protein
MEFWRDLLSATYHSFLLSWSATTLSICYQILAAFLLTEGITFIVVRIRTGRDAMKNRLENFKIGLIVFLILFLVYPATFTYQFWWNCREIWREADNQVIPVFARYPKPPDITQDSQDPQDEIEDIKKQLQSMSHPLPEKAFSVQSEFEMSSLGYPGRFTGLFVGSTNSIVPVTQLVFVRITNLLSVKTMIRRMDVSLDGCNVSNRLDTTMGQQVFQSLPKSQMPAHPGVGGTLIFKGGGTGISMVLDDLQSVDLSSALRLNLPLLDQLLSDHYLDSGDSIGGWLLFSSRCPGMIDQFTIEDVAGRTFKYSVRAGSKEMKNTNDLTNGRTMTIAQIVDLSRATVQGIQ